MTLKPPREPFLKPHVQVWKISFSNVCTVQVSVLGPGIPMGELVWDTQKEKDKSKMRTGLHAISDAELSTNDSAKTNLVQSKDLSFLHFSLVEVKHLHHFCHR